MPETPDAQAHAFAHARAGAPARPERPYESYSSHLADPIRTQVALDRRRP